MQSEILRTTGKYPTACRMYMWLMSLLALPDRDAIELQD